MSLLFVLLGLLSLVPGWLLVDVVLLVTVYRCQSGDGMGIDELVIIIQDPLPFLFSVVLVLLGPLPCSQSCISLPSSELRFTARSFW